MKDSFVSLGVNPEVAQKHVDLVNQGFQSRVRAIMAIYKTNRETAEQILVEIDEEQSGYSSDGFDVSALND